MQWANSLDTPIFYTPCVEDVTDNDSVRTLTIRASVMPSLFPIHYGVAQLAFQDKYRSTCLNGPKLAESQPDTVKSWQSLVASVPILSMFAEPTSVELGPNLAESKTMLVVSLRNAT